MIGHSIWKYTLAVVDNQEIRIPEPFNILCVKVQNNVPCLWALVPKTSKEDEQRSIIIRIHGTGHSVPDPEKLKYIDTFFMNDGAFVGHVFMVHG